MGSDEQNTQRKFSHALSDIDESNEEKEKEQDKKEKEIAFSHRNLIKIESLTMGEQYSGDLKGGKREGQGVCVYKNGDRYEGSWKNNKKEGKGLYYFTQKGELYKGNFFDDKPNGKGYYYYKNGDKYEGLFKDGKFHGEGTIIYSNGTRYKGEFKNGEKHGNGELKYPNGQVKLEFWDNGVIKRNKAKDYNENDSVNLQNENETKKFDEFLKNRGNYKKKINEKTSLFDKFKSIKEKLKNKLNYQQLVQIINIVKEKPNVTLWTIEDVKDLFMKISLEKYIQNIEDNAIDGRKLLILNNQSITTVFNNIDKNEIKIILTLIEFIGDISNNEQEKDDVDDFSNKNSSNNNVIIFNFKEKDDNKIISNKNENYDKKNVSNLKTHLTQEHKKENEKEEEIYNYLSEGNSSEEQIKKEIITKKAINKDKSEFYASLNNNSMNFFIDYDEIKKERPINKGGMGELYLGEWQGKQIALKKTKLNFIKNNFVSNKFIKEINIIASMRHPNILLFMGVTIDNNTYYMITEYLPSGSLHEYLHLSKKNKNNPLTYKQKIKIALQIAIAVKYIHSRQILHCDLKSGNILIDKHFNIKLIDFGLSYFMSEPPKGYIGTPRWMAPEILNGGEYTVASDVFSYGMILLELFTEKIPYSEKFNYEVKKDIIKKYVNFRIAHNLPILKIPETGNPVVKNIISNCLDANPKNRPTMDKIIEELSETNKYYEEIDEATLDMCNFLS